MTRDPNSVASRFQSLSLPFLMPGTHPAQEPPQPSGLGYLRELGPARGCNRSSPDPWEPRMVTSAGTLPSLLLGTLLTFTFGALGANPGLVVRITDQGLEYGREPRLSAGLADLLGPRLLWGQLGTQRGLSPSGWLQASRSGSPGSGSGLVTQLLGRVGHVACLSQVPTSQQQ